VHTWQVFVVSQPLLPLHYCMANRDDHDERFAWRMFSPMRMTRCEVNKSQGPRDRRQSLEVTARARS
jgi:hypothetical protein